MNAATVVSDIAAAAWMSAFSFSLTLTGMFSLRPSSVHGRPGPRLGGAFPRFRGLFADVRAFRLIVLAIRLV